ncbi:hypothetical protein J4Q44_G00044070 [Coregonus suidteri]|uniref:Uncharacterized protein n=1 Tax=Coregonus suidteri TaxID=861788 RepID=A0AAN8M547_9TELE
MLVTDTIFIKFHIGFIDYKKIDPHESGRKHLALLINNVEFDDDNMLRRGVEKDEMCKLSLNVRSSPCRTASSWSSCPRGAGKHHCPEEATYPKDPSFCSHREEDSGGGCWCPIHPTHRTNNSNTGSKSGSNKKKRCDVCGPKKDRKTQYTCIKCKKYVCNTHTVKLCPSCGV